MTEGVFCFTTPLPSRASRGELSNEVQHVYKQKLRGEEVEDFFGAVVDEVDVALKRFRIYL